jgi:hypothetical protein
LRAIGLLTAGLAAGAAAAAGAEVAAVAVAAGGAGVGAVVCANNVESRVPQNSIPVTSANFFPGKLLPLDKFIFRVIAFLVPCDGPDLLV